MEPLGGPPAWSLFWSPRPSALLFTLLLQSSLQCSVLAGPLPREEEDSAPQHCPLKEVDVRSLRNFPAFQAEFDREDDDNPQEWAPLQAVRLRGVTEGWAITNWTLARLLEKVGDVEVWPRDLRFAGPSQAARTQPAAIRDLVSGEPSVKSVFEDRFNTLSNALAGSYKIPRPFSANVHTSPVASMSRSGSGVGFHEAHSHFALWMAQVHGSTTWALLPPGEKPKKLWPWQGSSSDRIEQGSGCVLEQGDAIFVPRGYHVAFRTESDVNLVLGWGGETRPLGELEASLTAITNGDAQGLAKALAKFQGNLDEKEFMPPCVNHAMKTGHIPILKMLQKLGANFDEEIPTGGTHLHQAAASGQAESVRYAIEDGADPAVKHSKDGSYPIHAAAHAGHAGVVEVLMKKAKSGWKLKDGQGRLPMHIAAAHGHTAAMAALLSRRAKVDASDRGKLSPLHWAIEENQRTSVDYLLSIKADLEGKTGDGETPLHRAAVKGHDELLKQLLDARANLEAARPTGQTAVHIAAFLGHVSTLQILRDRGANMTPSEQRGHYSPEGLAANAGHTEVLEFLRGGSAKSFSLQGRDTPIRAAIQAGHMQMVKKLLDNEVQIGPPQERRFQLAHVAVEDGHMPIADFLLESGKLIEGRGSSGTLMQAAASKGHEALVAYLAESRSDPEARDVQGDRPLLLAAGKGHSSVVSRLLKLRADHAHRNTEDVTALHLAVLGGHGPAAGALLGAGASLRGEADEKINDENATGRYHIHVAAAAGHTSVVKTLIEHQADVMSKDRAGFVPSMLAAENGHVAMTKFLVKQRADLSYAVKGKSEDGAQVVEATALGIAGVRGHIQLLKYLGQDMPTKQLKAVAETFGKQHGDAWQKKLESALRLQARSEAAEQMKDTMADPEKRKRMEEFNEMYAKLSPKERAVVDAQMKQQHEESEAKQKYAEKEETRKNRRPAEL